MKRNDKSSGLSSRRPPKPARAARAVSPAALPSRFTGFIINYDLTDSTGRQRKLRGLLPDALDAERSIREWLFEVLRVGARAARIREAVLDLKQDHGDGFCFPVRQAVQAHRFAVAVHEECRRLNLRREEHQAFLFRFGIASGEITFLDDGKSFAATGADLAARLRAGAAPGGTMICPQTWQALPTASAEEYGTTQIEVPDKNEPTRFYRGHPWLLGSPPPQATGGVRKPNRRRQAKSPAALTRPSPQALEGYRRHLAHLFCEIGEASLRCLPTADSSGKPCLPPRLAKVYIPLDAKPHLLVGGGRLEPDAEPMLKRLATEKRLAVLGLPGSGKSTFLKHLALCLAQHALEPAAGWLKHLEVSYRRGDKLLKFAWPRDLNHLVPVFVELRKFADQLAQSPESNLARVDGDRVWHFIESQLPPLIRPSAAQALKAALEAGQAIVFLDGLDEVPDELKRFVVDTVAAFTAPPFERTRFVVTCRTVSYQDEAWQVPGFQKAEIERLDDEKIREFIGRFYAELLARGRDVPSQRVNSLTQAVIEREELHEMARTPYLLSLMAQLHLRAELPEKRAKLFALFVQELLFAWEATKERDAQGPAKQGLPDLLKEAETSDLAFKNELSRLAFRAHRGDFKGLPDDRQGTSIYIPEQDLADALAGLPPHDKWPAKRREDWAKDVIHLIEHRAGLLVAQGRHQFGMAFKLQEFMAAVHVCDAEHFDFESAAGLITDDGGYWEEVVRLAAGYQAHENNSPLLARSLAVSLCTEPAPSHSASVRRASLASQIVREIGLNDVKRSAKGQAELKVIRERLDGLVRQRDLQIGQRSEAASARGWLEDQPPGVGQDNGLPNIVWCGPRGEQAADKPLDFGRGFVRDGEKRAFFIAKYPITVAQFEAFVKAPDGYHHPKAWTSAEEPEMLEWWEAQHAQGPEDYDPVFQTPNHPRVGVCWYEAVAFCRWLSEKWSLEIRLPHENEWQLAAQWDGEKQDRSRYFAWGGTEHDGDFAQHCNCGQTGLGHTSAVGLFPSGKADCGAMDLSGNVWEWCSNWSDEKRKEFRVLRGGSWIRDVPAFLSCSCRVSGRPGSRTRNCGFRCVVVSGMVR